MKMNFFAAAAIFSVLFCIQPVRAETIEIPGTGAFEILLHKLANAYNQTHSNDRVIVPKSIGSSGGIRLVGEGQHILGRVARPLNDKEKQYNLEYLVFAKDPVVFAVSRRVKIGNLSTQQLIDIYSGRITNWREVEGENLQIRLLAREPDDSSFLIIKKHIMAFKRVRFPRQTKYSYHDNEMIEMLKKYSSVIGWLTGSSYNSISQYVTALSLDGVEPTTDNILANRYKLCGEYAIVYKKDNLTPAASNFLDFLASREVSEILQNEGVIPVSR